MRRHALLFIGLFLIIAAARFTILLASQTHVHSDEAIIGLMGKHILEGRYSPFYMYGQPYNAGAAWEAYLAAIAFALAPSLLKWHFQVRGYSWYFLSIPLLTILFLSIQSAPNPRRSLFLLFGTISGLSIWSLELGIAFSLALWILFLIRRNVSFTNALVALAGFIIGYSPAIAFNLTHHFANWNAVVEKTGGGGFAILFRADALSQIFLTEMPKFFGIDTVLWYYPEKSALGFVFYAIALLAAGVAVWPFIRSPSKIVAAVCGGFRG